MQNLLWFISLLYLWFPPYKLYEYFNNASILSEILSFPFINSRKMYLPYKADKEDYTFLVLREKDYFYEIFIWTNLLLIISSYYDYIF